MKLLKAEKALQGSLFKLRLLGGKELRSECRGDDVRREFRTEEEAWTHGSAEEGMILFK